jgi:thiamine-phosphate pyrophosphorylase
MVAPPGHPIICLVTDRRQLPDPAEEHLVRLVAQAIAAGVNLVHVRERDLDDRRLYSLTRRIVAAAAGTTAIVVVNDRTDIALAAGASGVHLRSDSVPADRVRSIVPDGFLVGRSVHSAHEAAAAAATGVDYLVMGTIYPTPSKPQGAPLAGLRGLEATCRSVQRPVVAIGGITSANVREVAAAGAAGIAAIGLFVEATRDRTEGEIAISLARVVAALRAGFA